MELPVRQQDDVLSELNSPTSRFEQPTEPVMANLDCIISELPNGFATFDREWRYIYANNRLLEIFKLSRVEVLGKKAWEVFPHQVGIKFFELLNRAMTERIEAQFEFYYELAECWVEHRLYPTAEGLAILMADISERKRTELARIAAEQERDRFFDVSLDLLLIATFDGDVVRLNSAYERILGFTIAELMAQPFFDFVHPDDRAATAAATENMRTGNVFINFENRYRCRDGSYRWISWSVTPDLERKLIYANGHDITDRKIAELNAGFLYELMQRLRQLSDPEAIQWEAVKSIGEYLNVDRAMWYEVDETRWLARVSRDWNRDGADSIVGEYPLDEFLSPTFQAAMLAGEPMAISDVTADPLTAAYSDNYRQVGIRAFTNIPCLDDEGRWVMTLHLNTSQNVRSWRDDEIQLMQTLVTQLWSFVAQARAVRALRAQEEQTRAAQAIVQQQLGEIESIYQMAPVGLCFVDTNFRYVRINEQLAQINGLSIAEHIGKTFGEVLPELVDTIQPLYRQVMESGEPIIDLEVTGTNLAQPGVERCWLASFYPQTDDRGRVIGVNNVVQEITDRKRDEERLRQSEELTRRILESNRDCIKVLDLAGRLVYMNNYGQSLMEVDDFSTVAGSQWLELWQGSDRESARTAFSIALAGGVNRFDGYCTTCKGTPKWWEVIVTPILAADGQVSQILSVSRDITERKQSQTALEERNRELDSFVYVVSHDLKAPLRAVSNLSKWIEDDLEGQLTADTRSQMNLLRSRVARMAATIDGLLDYSRVGRSEDAIETVAVAQLLEEVIDSVAPPPAFTIVLPAELPTISTKRLPLFQVFANLIGNGIKHHHSETGKIQMTIAERGNFYEFAIADDGPGIAPADRERMFKIFQAVNPQNRADSTGIGLAIVKKIIEAESGTIRLESEIGKGTTFYFTWPKVM